MTQALVAGPTDCSDEQLVARAVAGDVAALETLLVRHRDHARRLALRITGRADDADDAVQAAFVTTWRRLAEFRSEARFGTWFHRVVANCAVSQVRARARSDRQRELGSLPPADQPRSPEPAPESLGEATAFLRELRRAADGLSPDLRTCWYARDVGGLSYAEVAQLTGVRSDTVRGRIARARRRLATELADWQ